MTSRGRLRFLCILIPLITAMCAPFNGHLLQLLGKLISMLFAILRTSNAKPDSLPVSGLTRPFAFPVTIYIGTHTPAFH